ncbi:MAG TPA: fused MFS/spermidine synthase [Steroidobacteraceae bacterium]|nr:fused MFS/spermidine synthase [Steroidobacteraceae bacterium]
MTDAQDRGRWLFFVIFTISGFSGLIYESIWSHYLKLFLGHAAYAQTLVLAIFMGGMALGSWIMARNSVRMRNLLLGYAIVEGIIGLLGLIFHKTSILATSWAFDVLLPNVGSPLVAQISKWTIGALLILPQSILLGMTFPLMSGAIVRRFPARSGETLAMLYFTNSFGAAIGVLVSGFYLIGAVGLPGTIMTAGLLNVALALTVWGIVKYQPETVRPPAKESASTAQSGAPGIRRWMLIGAAVTGGAAFLYEIAWIRMLSLVLGSTTHSFELMLSAFILGIALGGLWVRRRIDGLSNPVRYLGNILMIMACLALVSLPVYNATFDLMSATIHMFSPTEQGYLGFNLASHAIAMLVMIPTTFFCGMTLPIITHALIRTGSGEQAIGAVYAWNTAGAIVGVLLSVHLLMPTIGVKGIVIVGALLQMALGLVYLSGIDAPRGTATPLTLPAVIGSAAVLAALFLFQLDPEKLSSGVFRHGRAGQAAGTKVLFLQHGKTATVSLVDVNGLVSIATNGKPDAAIMMRGTQSATDEITMVVAGALPIALHPHPSRVANIGIGSGLTSQVLLASDAVTELDTIEIEPLMAKAAQSGFMPRVERTFQDPRSKIYFEDAKSFFAVHRKKYDVIVSEPSNPWVSGVATLFSQEFYRHIVRYLEPDGMLVQWVQVYETNLDILTSVMKALAPNFADFRVYNADDTNLLIVAVRTGTLPKLDARLFEAPKMQAELKRVGIVSVESLESRFLGNKRLLLPLLRASGIPVNSDYFPYVDLNAPRARFLRQHAGEFASLAILPVPLMELLDGAAPSRDRTTFATPAFSSRDMLVIEASGVRDAIEQSSLDALTPEAAKSLLVLRSSKEQCAMPAAQLAWLDSVVFVAAETSTALGAKELQRTWGVIEATPCATAVSAQRRDLVSFLKAVALRDTPRVASLGAALFASNYPFANSTDAALALIATAASQISTGRAREGIQLIEQQKGLLDPSPSEQFALRWLQAIAADDISGGQSATGHQGTRPAATSHLADAADISRH